MINLNITVTKKVATYLQRDGAIVCGNSDYQITFTFDAEWDAYPTKTARFIWNGKYWDQPFTGNVCPVPIITGATEVTVGVYAGDLRTTTPASIPCKRSILCGVGQTHDEKVADYRDAAESAAVRAEEAAQRAEDATGGLEPRFANDISECTDTSKLYVLPNGFIYAYMKTVVEGGPLFKNLADPTSEDWKAAYQFTNTAGFDDYGGDTTYFVTNAIPCHGKDTLRIKGCFDEGTMVHLKAALYKAEAADSTCRDSGPVWLTRSYDEASNNNHVGNHVIVTVDPDNPNIKTYEWEIWRYGAGDGYNYKTATEQYWIRISGRFLGEVGDIIVTLNEEIAYNEGGEVWGWANTGHAFVPADYEDRIVDLENFAEEIDQTIEEVVKANATAFDYTAYGLPILYFNGSTAGMNKDNKVTLDYVYGERTGTCTVKWQGSSSLTYPKKNYTVTFDNAFEAFAGWGAQKKYCMKANFMDFSHSRNLCCAKLWAQVVKSRPSSNALYSTLSALPNYGAVDGFPIVIVINDEYKGIYTFNIPKDAWTFGMGNGTQEAILCADKYSTGNYATLFENEAVCDGTDFELEYATDEDNASWVATSLNRLIRAVLASDGTDIDTTIAQYVDIQSAIDYLLFTQLVHGADMVKKNYILATYDGVKWFFSAYDMDSTFGITADGGYNKDSLGAFKQAVGSEGEYPVLSSMRAHKLFNLLCNHKADEIKARYNELRAGAMSEANVAHEFNEFTALIPKPYFDEEPKLWASIPATSANNASQIVTHYMLRTKKVDADIEAL